VSWQQIGDIAPEEIRGRGIFLRRALPPSAADKRGEVFPPAIS
jgi:hypothetical protein